MEPKVKKYSLLTAAVSLIITALVFFACGDDKQKSSANEMASYTDIVINEVQSNNTGGFIESDFVELYNKSDKPYVFADGEWYITDSKGANNSILYIPDKTIIPAGGYLVLLPDEIEMPGDAPSGSIFCDLDGRNINFGLGSDDAVSLYYLGSANASPEVAVDSTSWTSHVSSRVRIPDGGTWDPVDAHAPTPGADNESAKAITTFSFTDPDAAGVIDEEARTITVSVPYGTTVTALVAIFTFSGYSVEVNNVPQTSGETPNDFTGSVKYTVTAADGSTAEYTVTVNVAAYDSDIVINEVQSNPTDTYFSLDFVELYNSSGTNYTFTGGEWYITDSAGAGDHIFYIPGGTIIPANGYVVMLPDVNALPSDAPAGSIACVADGTNSDPFGLGSSDSVYLFFTGSANLWPGIPVDSTSWTSHVKTRVRIPDGGAWDTEDVHNPTPGTTNE